MLGGWCKRLFHINFNYIILYCVGTSVIEHSHVIATHSPGLSHIMHPTPLSAVFQLLLVASTLHGPGSKT